MINIINTIRNKFQKQQQMSAEARASQTQEPAESLTLQFLKAAGESAIKGTLTHDVLDAIAFAMDGFLAESRVNGFRSIMLHVGCVECLCADSLRRMGAACMQCHIYAEPVTRSEKRAFAVGERLIELASKKEAMTPAEREQFEQTAREELVLLRYRAEQRAAKFADQDGPCGQAGPVEQAEEE